jgi:hypothetical protein
MATELDRPSPPVRQPPVTQGVIPAGEVVILRERDLDCDLQTAIARVRAAPETARSRILVVAAEEVAADSADRADAAARAEAAALADAAALAEAAALAQAAALAEEVGRAAAAVPKDPAAAAGGAAVPRLPTALRQIARRGEAQALSELGKRVRPLVGCLHRFLAEARAAIEAAGASLRAGETAAAGERLRALGDVTSWAEAVAEDLDAEARAASEGFQPVLTRDLVQEVAGQVEARLPRVRVGVAADLDVPPCWGRTADLAEAFFLGLVLVAQRIGERGTVAVELVAERGQVAHRFWGSGEPVPIGSAAVVARFRRLVERSGGTLAHDELGPHGTGVTLRLPAAG